MTGAATFINPRLVTDSDNAQLDELLDHVVEAVQITATQHQSADKKYNAVAEWLSAEGSSVRGFSPKIYPQGSLLIGTTVRPLASEEFDLDLVCELVAAAPLTPAQAYDLLWSRMEGHESYKQLKQCPRCIRVNYAGDFHLDIVPAIPDPNGVAPTALLIPDRELRSWHPSNPKGYAEWFEDRARLPTLDRRTLGATIEPLRAREPAAAKPPLKLAVQLFKRWRDVAFSARTEDPPPSIVLTTIAGHVYGKESHVTDALSAIVMQTLAWSNREVIDLMNPANPHESITERWLAAPGAYNAFRQELAGFAATWQALVQRATMLELGETLKRLFGEKPVARALKVFAESRKQAREAGDLHALQKTGTLVMGNTANALPVRNHTFFGSDHER